MLQRGSILQRSAAPTISPTAVELNENWQHSLKDQWGDVLRGLVQLPTTLNGFLVYLAGLGVICTALAIYVLLSVQIRDAQLQVWRLENELARVEQTNSELIFQMAEKTSMAQMNRRALDEGYVHNVQRLYVHQGSLVSSVAATQPAAMQGPTTTDEKQTVGVTSASEAVGEPATNLEPAILAKEMGQTVGTATGEAMGFLTVQGGRAAASMAVQSERAGEWLGPLWNQAKEFFVDQQTRIEQAINR